MQARVQQALRSPGVPGAVLLHIGLLGALMLAAQQPPPAAIEPVAVELVSDEQFRAAARRQEPSSGEPAPTPAPLVEAPAATPSERAPQPVVRPRIMLSERTLSDPRSRQARAALAQMTGEERMVQLCDVEAMAQIAAWSGSFRPDRVVDQATAETRVAGNRVVADGAAFRSDHAWYGLRFRCELSADFAKVAAFEFKVGEPIPAEDWESLGLPPVY